MIKLENIETNNLEIKLDFIYANHYSINETIYINNNFRQILEDIVHIVEEYGYMELERDKSPYSTSMYITFCNDDKFNSSTVDLVTRLRVSDHKLNLHKNDKTYQDAINRQLNDLQKYANKHKDMNKNLSDDEDMPVTMLYVQYENEFYTTLEDLYNKIRRKLQEFKNKHK